jgi:crotonobetainyl-CoA:carnitine CoA-transferase CaiB-like acyl-CoA transferase
MVDPASSNHGERFIARRILRVAALCIAGLAIACAGRESDKDRKAREAAALQAKVNERLKAENLAAAHALQELARVDREATNKRAVETQAESAAAFAKYLAERQSMTVAEESAATELGLARIRSRMTDPDAMEVRNAHVNVTKNAVCAEVNYKEAGKYLGFRRAYVTADVIWVEPPETDVTHRAFELNFKRVGCDRVGPPL